VSPSHLAGTEPSDQPLPLAFRLDQRDNPGVTQRPRRRTGGDCPSQMEGNAAALPVSTVQIGSIPCCVPVLAGEGTSRCRH
jgi:hypothetical protein